MSETLKKCPSLSSTATKSTPSCLRSAARWRSTAARAEQQDIRPLEIAIINLMADKDLNRAPALPLLARQHDAAGEPHLRRDRRTRTCAAWRLGVTPGIRRPITSTSSTKHSATSGDQKFDGFIVTGVNALKDRVEQEIFWPEVADILQWTTTHAFSCLFLCWGAEGGAASSSTTSTATRASGSCSRPVRASP